MRETIFQRLAYPAIDGGEVDLAIDTMEKQLRVLNAFAIAVEEGGYPHDPSEDLCGGIQALYDSWIHFRRTELPEKLAAAVKDDSIRNVTEGRVVGR